MKLRLSAFIGLAGLLLFATSCGKSHKGDEQRIHGKIRAIDLNAHTLVITEKVSGSDSNEVGKVRKTYRVAFDCRISTPDMRKAELSDLKVGDRINIRFTVQDGELIAHRITPRGLGTSEESNPKPQ